MKCPRCQGSLKAETFEGITIDKCGSCKGLWLDDGELLSLMRNEASSVSASQIAEAKRRATPGVSKAERDSIELCPHCQASMTPVNYDYTSGVTIDSCPNGHGIWLDEGELERLRAHRLASAEAAAKNGAMLAAKVQSIGSDRTNLQDDTAGGGVLFSPLLRFLGRILSR